MRVALVHERFPPDWGGGGEYVVLETARHLQSAGHEVTVITAGDPSQREFEGVRVVRIPVSRAAFNLQARAIARHARGVDLVHCFNYHGAWPGLRAARILGVPVVLEVLALFGGAWHGMKGPAAGLGYRAFEALLMRLPFDARIFLSEGSMRLAHAMAPARPGDAIVAPGIALADYRPAARKEGVVFSGKFESRKGIGDVLEVARRLPRISFRAIGWGPEYESIAASAPANLKVEPFMTREALAQALAGARIFLFPSRAETFGLVVAEAMASGCAVVASAPIPFEGERVTPGDIGGIQAALERLDGDPARSASCGERNTILAREYDWNLHVRRLEEIYRSVKGEGIR
jgi:glycosyltransferase involved in cell wall biosynthesis